MKNLYCLILMLLIFTIFSCAHLTVVDYKSQTNDSIIKDADVFYDSGKKMYIVSLNIRGKLVDEENKPINNENLYIDVDSPPFVGRTHVDNVISDSNGNFEKIINVSIPAKRVAKKYIKQKLTLFVYGESRKKINELDYMVRSGGKAVITNPFEIEYVLEDNGIIATKTTSMIIHKFYGDTTYEYATLNSDKIIFTKTELYSEKKKKEKEIKSGTRYDMDDNDDEFYKKIISGRVGLVDEKAILSLMSRKGSWYNELHEYPMGVLKVISKNELIVTDNKNIYHATLMPSCSKNIQKDIIYSMVFWADLMGKGYEYIMSGGYVRRLPQIKVFAIRN